MLRRLLNGKSHKSTATEAIILEKSVIPGVSQLNAIALDTSLNIVLFTIQDYYLLRQLYGEEFIKKLELQLSQSLSLASGSIADAVKVEFFATEPGDYLLIWPLAERDQQSLGDVAYALKLQARNNLKEIMLKWTGRDIDLSMGCARYVAAEGDNHERAFFRAISDARRQARSNIDLTQLELAAQFNHILSSRNVTSHYQPILDFRSGKILGWEALARGPRDTPFQSPLMLFELAEKLERLFALEEICRERAISGLGPILPEQKLFLNIHPKTMVDPEFTPGETLKILEANGLSPENIVFEITERHSVQDFGLFYRTLDHYRSQGYQVAVDDAGAGYSGLTTIAEIQPDYIKADMSLVRNIDRDPVKRALLETFVTFADKIGSKIIAEGIETRAQANCLVEIGVHFGQGYYLARPAAPRPELSIDLDEIRPVSEARTNLNTCSIPVGKLAEAPFAVEKSHLVSEAQSFFDRNRQFSSIIVVEDDIPAGLVMEYHLNRQLSAQYGVALYFKRPLAAVMDKNPLVIDEMTPVEEAAKQAMKRDSLKAYDDIIVTRKGRLFGVISVQKVLNTLAQVQVEMAKGTNPLTGLPGNVSFEQEVEGRIGLGKPFAIIYADLDHFKVYNDSYGFKNGDRVIKLTADILSWAVRRHGTRDSVLCHIGGDDFVAIVPPSHAERVCLGVNRCFRRAVRGCYCQKDRERGWIFAVGRDGMEREYPLVSISLGILEIHGSCTLMEIGERAAHIKKYAKSIPGNSVARDRRPPLGSTSPTCPDSMLLG